MTNEIVTKDRKTAIEAMASRLQVSTTQLQKTLQATAFKECKTAEEFIVAVIVANNYQLNPLTKEIYAYKSEKGGGVIPIVSTDGWTKLMTSHPKYKTHSFRYSEKMVTLKGAKPCPEWCEIDIEKEDGSHMVVREYLDEVFRDLSFQSPWQTHTKRMLRHKTKIQGAREAFGFSGIYDQDEAERIVEAQIVSGLKDPASIQMPQPKTISSPSAQGVDSPRIEASPVLEAPEPSGELSEEEKEDILKNERSEAEAAQALLNARKAKAKANA